MARWAFAVMIGAAVATAVPAAAADVCRANTLGTVNCPAPPPKARPIYRAPVQALDRVRARDRQPETETFIPAYRTNRLGGIVIDGGGAAGRCRADVLGNLHCR